MGRQSQTAVVVNHRDREEPEAGGHSAAGAAPEAGLQGRCRSRAKTILFIRKCIYLFDWARS